MRDPMPPPRDLPNIARLGALIGNPLRAQFLDALMDGSERSASALAAGVGATPQAASAHLAGLVAGELLTVRIQGRYRYYRLRSPQVAAAIEALSLMAMQSARPPAVREELRRARRCYDHLAGRLGVLLCRAAVEHRYVIAGAEGAILTAGGERWIASLGIEMPRALRRPLVRFCQDWTERRPHLAGWLGAALRQQLEEKNALRCQSGSRALSVTPTGRVLLAQLCGARLAAESQER